MFRAISMILRFGITLLAFSLLVSEDFWPFLIFPAIAIFSAHLSEGIKSTAIAEREENQH